MSRTWAASLFRCASTAPADGAAAGSRSCRARAGSSPRRCRSEAGRRGAGSGPGRGRARPAALEAVDDVAQLLLRGDDQPERPRFFWNASARPCRSSMRCDAARTYWPTSSTTKTSRASSGAALGASSSSARSANQLASMLGGCAASRPGVGDREGLPARAGAWRGWPRARREPTSRRSPPGASLTGHLAKALLEVVEVAVALEVELELGEHRGRASSRVARAALGTAGGRRSRPRLQDVARRSRGRRRRRASAPARGSC